MSARSRSAWSIGQRIGGRKMLVDYTSSSFLERDAYPMEFWHPAITFRCFCLLIHFLFGNLNHQSICRFMESATALKYIILFSKTIIHEYYMWKLILLVKKKERRSNIPTYSELNANHMYRSLLSRIFYYSLWNFWVLTKRMTRI